MRKTPLFILSLILLILFAVGVVQVYANKKAEEKVREVLSSFELEERTRYGEVKYSLLKGTTEVRGLEIETDTGKLRIERLLINKFSDADLELRLEGIRGEDRTFREFEKDMGELGYRDVSLNAVLSLSFYDEEKRLLLRELSLRFPTAFKVSLNLELSGVSKELIKELSEFEESNREALNKLAKELGRVNLISLRAEFQDKGLLDRLIEQEARKRKKKPDEIREEFLKEIKELKEGSEFERSLYTALNKFLEEGGTLSMVAKPDKPVPFESLIIYTLIGLQSKDFSGLVRVLNLRTEHRISSPMGHNLEK